MQWIKSEHVLFFYRKLKKMSGKLKFVIKFVIKLRENCNMIVNVCILYTFVYFINIIGISIIIACYLLNYPVVE